MSALNAVLRPLFDALLAPFQGLPPIVGVTLSALVLAVVALWMVKLTSDSEKVDARKRKVAAGLLEIRLFNDSLPTIFKAIGSILKHQSVYVLLLGIPFLLMIVLFLPVFAQQQFHWGYRGLQPGDEQLLKVTMQEGWARKAPVDSSSDIDRPELQLEVPAGLRLDSPAVWSPGTRELAWRLVVETEGDYEIGVRLGDEVHGKTLAVTDRVKRLSPSRLEPSFWNQLLYPAEPPLSDAAGIESIAFEYPPRDVWFFFWRAPWWLPWLVFSIVFALILRKPMGVTI